MTMEVATVDFLHNQWINLLLLTVLVCLVVQLVLERWGRKLPPGPFAWPIIGNIRWFEKDPQGYKKFTDLASRYGNIYR